MSITSYHPRTGLADGVVLATTSADLEAVLRASGAAAAAVADAEPRRRHDWLYAVAETVEPHQDELVTLADAESALGSPRLTDEAATAIRLLSAEVGRVCVNGWPTGVAVSWAQQHGGPWPSTSAPASTSVGAAVLDRSLRPVTYQSAQDAWLPEPVRAANAWRVPQRIDGVMQVAEPR